MAESLHELPAGWGRDFLLQIVCGWGQPRPQPQPAFTLATGQPEEPSPESVQSLHHASAALPIDVPPGRGQPQRRLSLVERPVRGLEPQASIARLRTETLGGVEANPVECSLQLRGEIAVLAPDSLDERASAFDDGDDLF